MVFGIVTLNCIPIKISSTTSPPTITVVIGSSLMSQEPLISTPTSQPLGKFCFVFKGLNRPVTICSGWPWPPLPRRWSISGSTIRLPDGLISRPNIGPQEEITPLPDMGFMGFIGCSTSRFQVNIWQKMKT